MKEIDNEDERRKTFMKAVEIPSCHLSTLPTVSTVTVKKFAHRTELKRKMQV